MQLAHKTPCLLPQMFVEDTELKKRFLSCSVPSWSFLAPHPPPFVSVWCQTAPLLRCRTEIKCYCPATLLDDNVSASTAREGSWGACFLRNFSLQLEGASELFGQDLSFVGRPLIQSVSLIQQCSVILNAPLYCSCLGGGERQKRLNS